MYASPIEVSVVVDEATARAAAEHKDRITFEYHCAICGEHHTAEADVDSQQDMVFLSFVPACEGEWDERQLEELHEDPDLLAAVRALGPAPAAPDPVQAYWDDIRASRLPI